jgi:hypothetical protein
VGVPNDPPMLVADAWAQRGHFGIGRTADRDLHRIDFEQRLYLLVHGLHLTRKVSNYMLTQGAVRRQPMG